MTHDEATRPWGLGGLAIAAFVLAVLVLGAVRLWRGFGADDRPRDPSGVVAPEEPSLAQPSPAPRPPKPLAAEGRPRPRGASRVEPAPSLRGTTDLRADAQRREPRATTSRSAAAAEADDASAGGTSDVAPHTPDARTESPTGRSSGLPTPGELVPRGGGAAPAAAEAGTSDDGDTPTAKTPVELEPGADRTPPVLEMLRFEPPVVEGGSVTTLTIQASDDLSGVKSVRGEIRSPNRLALLPFGSADMVSGDVSFAITIPRRAESGVWYVSWISLTDRAANASLVQAPTAAAAPRGGTLTVHSSESDSTPPEVLQVWFERPTVEGGEKNAIKVEARDDASEVISITGACQSRSRSALIWFTCAMNAESGIWEGDVLLPANADCGEWGVQQLAAKDEAGNTRLLLGDSWLLAGASFYVSFGTDCDSTPPTLSAFDLSPTMVSSETATEILVTATVHDEGSGAIAMTGWFDGPVSTSGQTPKIYFRCSPDPNDPAAQWTGKILVPQFAAKGSWRVGVIRLEDKAHNFREYTTADSVVFGRVFDVQ